MSPFDAAIKGAREIATPVISMTITLAAVYAPIGFIGGVTGGLFSEFAYSGCCGGDLWCDCFNFVAYDVLTIFDD